MKIISITGLDGSGKSTQAKLLQKKFPNSRIVSVWDIIKRPEFQSWTIYRQTPDVENYVTNLHPVSRSMFIFHAFNEAYQKAVQSGVAYLIMDGNWHKYWAIEQAMGAPAKLGKFIQSLYPVPDFSFYLELEIDEIVKRKKVISVYEGGHDNRLEKFRQIQTRAKDILEKILPHYTVRIDARKSIDEIHHEIMQTYAEHQKTVKQLLADYQEKLKHIYPPEEITAVFYRLTKYYWNIERLDIALNPQTVIPDLRMHKALQKLLNYTPWQHITCGTEFYGKNFLVTKDVLIPRPETEELVSWVIKDVQSDFDPKENVYILDIGTGSGAIAVNLAYHLKNARVEAVDISTEALDIARRNARMHGVKISFDHRDIFKYCDLNRFDIIVSNPPYVRHSEKKDMHPNVVQHEPATALFVPDDNPLKFYKRIIDLSLKTKQPQWIYFEINENLKPELEALLQSRNITDYRFKKDIFGKWRMLKIVK